MNVLVIGSNGREHALAVAYAKSKKVKKVVMTPGNGLTDFTNKKIKNYSEISMMDFDGIVKICKKENIDLVDVGQDEIIAAGFVDKLTELGIQAFGPTQKASQLEWDKKWARDFMTKTKLPIPAFASFHDTQKATAYINKLSEQLLFVKASGLALGKGVIRAENKIEAKDAIRSMKNFGKSGETFLIEEGLIGEEFSLFAICDGQHFVITKSSQDHKTVYNADKGPNTAGIGCVAPASVVTSKVLKEAEEKIIKPTLLQMQKEKRPFRGILYLGGIVTKKGVKIIEFNARWGDPEAEVIIPSITTDYVDIVTAVLNENLHKTKVSFDNKTRVCVSVCARGYPTEYTSVKGKEIFGVLDVMKQKGITLFGSNIIRKGKRFFVNGGRILQVVAEGKDVRDARRLAYEALSMLYVEGNNLHFRTDIGWRELERIYQ